MAKASDPRLADITKKRPSSAPKPGELTDIPKIFLGERKEIPPPFSSTLTTSVYSGSLTGSVINPRDVDKEIGGLNFGLGYCHVTGSHTPVRSSSDIGLPTTSMPNLTLPAVSGSDISTNENYLEVFCSPRTFRRSVDFDINSKDHTHFEWVDTAATSSNSLKVLTSSSRVGSALSLNSECTARSIGLLSNDSDSDNDLSLTESEKLSTKPSHLRRFMSYPEDSDSNDMCTRPSQSMSDFKTMENKNAKQELDSDATISVTESVEFKSDNKPCSVSGANKPESGNEDVVTEDQSSLPCDLRLQERKIRTNKREIGRDRSRGGNTKQSHMLSYKCDTNDSTRDGRIRQWLQDMDSQN